MRSGSQHAVSSGHTLEKGADAKPGKQMIYSLGYSKGEFGGDEETGMTSQITASRRKLAPLMLALTGRSNLESKRFIYLKTGTIIIRKIGQNLNK